MFRACSFEASINGDIGHFCALFQDADLQIFEYQDDLDAYWVKGYGHPLNYQISYGLMQNFFNAMDAVIAGGTQKANMRFAHAETLLPFIALLVIYIIDRHW